MTALSITSVPLQMLFTLPHILYTCQHLCLSDFLYSKNSSEVQRFLILLFFPWQEMWTSKIFKENICSSFTDFVLYSDPYFFSLFLWLLLLLNLLYFLFYNSYSCILDILELTSMSYIFFSSFSGIFSQFGEDTLSKVSFLILRFFISLSTTSVKLCGWD